MNRYRFGIDTSRDYIAAAQWMLVAYRQDVPRERNQALFQDKPVNPFADATRAIDSSLSAEERLWQEALRKIYVSLEQSNAQACREIGVSYRDGSSLTPQDSILAYAWLRRAADLKETQATSKELAELERGLSSEQLALAQSRFLPKGTQPK